LYVDDGVIFGTPKVIEQVMKSISSVLKVKDLGEVKKFIGCPLLVVVWFTQQMERPFTSSNLGWFLRPEITVL
jgi:hypothetical protein